MIKCVRISHGEKIPPVVARLVTYLLVDQARNALDTTTTRQTTNRWLGTTCDKEMNIHQRKRVSVPHPQRKQFRPRRNCTYMP